MSAADTALAELRAGRLAGATRLKLGGGLRTFPPEIFALADTLEELDLSGNALDALPPDLHRLHRLRVLFCSGNPFVTLPAVLGRCARLEMVGFKSCRLRHVPAEALPARLRWLILTDNAIDTLPDALGDCTRLHKLMLAGNRLAALPERLAQCRSLELLRLAANRFEALPPWLADLPRLAWLAVAGNPLCAQREDAARQGMDAPLIDVAQLRMGATLGEGASGVIQGAQWQPAVDASPEDVAVKRFKGAVTSDGWPASEMAAVFAAGTHPGLIPLRGRLQATAAEPPALVLARLGPEWRPLAAPPSLASCTRDVYAPDLRLDAGSGRRIAAEVAGAVAHLHARRVLHGDLYAHNILWRPAGGGQNTRALLGDFGAAALPPPQDWPLLQRLEARAFGCLLEELIDCCETPAALPDLAAWRDACLADAPASRPDFATLASALAGA